MTPPKPYVRELLTKYVGKVVIVWVIVHVLK